MGDQLAATDRFRHRSVQARDGERHGGQRAIAVADPGHAGPASINTTRSRCVVYEQQSLRKGFERFNPSASDQVARLDGRAATAPGRAIG